MSKRPRPKRAIRAAGAAAKLSATSTANNLALPDEIGDLRAQLREALQRQSVTAGVLKVISNATFDLQTVLAQLTESAAELCDAEMAGLARPNGAGYSWVTSYGVPAAFKTYTETVQLVPGRQSAVGRALMDGHFAHIPDVLEDPDYAYRDAQKLAGFRSVLAVPLLRDGAPLGVLFLARQSPRPFSEKQIELVESFAAQAVIAMENARLLNELRQRTDDLSEALDQQTATGEILTSISGSMTDTKPVFEAIVRNLTRLFGTRFAVVQLLNDGVIEMAATDRRTADIDKMMQHYPRPLDADTIGGQAMLSKQVVQVAPVRGNPAVPAATKEIAEMFGIDSFIFAPMIRGDKVVGAVGTGRREPKEFDSKQVALIKGFADQAVIAIENTRLLNELREALQQQTATAEVLKVISRSTFDLQAVLDTLVKSATQLCDTDHTWLFVRDGEAFRWAASFGHDSDTHNRIKNYFLDRIIPVDRGSVVGRVALEGKVVHVPDVLADQDYTWRGAQEVGGYRAILGAPLLRQSEVVGVITVMKSAPGHFTPRQIELATTFADQAVIAIENTRLFSEVQARTEDLAESLQQQTATADVLKVISRSTFDLQTVLQTLVESAVNLCAADQGTIAQSKGDKVFYRSATYGFSREFTDYVRELPVTAERGSATGRALLEGRAIHIPDIDADPDYTFFDAKRLGGFRTILAVPMLREGEAIGVFALTRAKPQKFTDKQIELVSTFADQAAIAIENVRLFERVQAHTRELAASLEELRAAQDRLIQTEKLASLGQLTAGIAHEIKNPLNFVNNFSSVSIELIDELRELLDKPAGTDAQRAEISDLLEMLEGNLDKIAQHGKRADSIVKNMLLHARQGSGEHRPIDINMVVEESLNLAYHGARAEKQGFNITLERSFDPRAGEVDLFPQEITRVLLNLIANGFYAATKRKAENADGDYEPQLFAATKDLGDSVEITIRDNGTGIPPEVRSRIFNPFYTTKPAGEGTGLGLSLSHDIVVKQHAGSIEVDTVPGEFTEFRIVLPRAAATIAKSRGAA